MPFATVDEYFAAQPEDVRNILEEVRRTIRGVVPDGEETISYQIPTVTLHGKPVVHYAGWARHVSLYPVPRGDEDFEHRVAPYLSGKGTVKLPLSEPVPHDLVRRQVELLLAERHQG